MKKSGASQGQSAGELISKRIAELGDWRGETLSTMRQLIKAADPDVVEEWKWGNHSVRELGVFVPYRMPIAGLYQTGGSTAPVVGKPPRGP
jgi:hypothetical protein